MNHLVDQYFDSLTDKRVAVLGIGVSNRPLIRMLLARGICVLAQISRRCASCVKAVRRLPARWRYFSRSAPAISSP